MKILMLAFESLNLGEASSKRPGSKAGAERGNNDDEGTESTETTRWAA